jgi:hypothetical protein
MGGINIVRKELGIVAATLVGDTRPLCYPLADRGIQFGLVSEKVFTDSP